jgi:hypothetical protein
MENQQNILESIFFFPDYADFVAEAMRTWVNKGQQLGIEAEPAFRHSNWKPTHFLEGGNYTFFFLSVFCSLLFFLVLEEAKTMDTMASHRSACLWLKLF